MSSYANVKHRQAFSPSVTLFEQYGIFCPRGVGYCNVISSVQSTENLCKNKRKELADFFGKLKKGESVEITETEEMLTTSLPVTFEIPHKIIICQNIV